MKRWLLSLAIRTNVTIQAILTMGTCIQPAIANGKKSMAAKKEDTHGLVP